MKQGAMCSYRSSLKGQDKCQIIGLCDVRDNGIGSIIKKVSFNQLLIVQRTCWSMESVFRYVI